MEFETKTFFPTTANACSEDVIFADKNVITLKCLGDYVNKSHQYLNSYPSRGLTNLSAGKTGTYTHWWEVQANSDGSISLKSFGNPAFAYLDGLTQYNDVKLAPHTSGVYTGTHWEVNKLDDDSYSFKCLGTYKNPKCLYLDGLTREGAVKLAPHTEGPYTGTHWEVQVLLSKQQPKSV